MKRHAMVQFLSCSQGQSVMDTRTDTHTHTHARTEPQQRYYILSPTRCAGITTRQTEKNMTPINQCVGWKSMTYFENINFTVFLAWVLALQKAAKVQRINALQSSTGKKIHVPGNKISWNEMKWLHEPKIWAVCTVTLTFEKWPWIKVKIKREAQRSTYRAPEYNVPPFWQIGRGGNFYLLIGLNNTNMERRWGLASCQVSLNSVQQFQRRSLKCLSLSNARAAILFSDRSEKHKPGRERWDLASCQVSLNSFKQFQRRVKNVKVNNGRRDDRRVITIVHLSLRLRCTKKYFLKSWTIIVWSTIPIKGGIKTWHPPQAFWVYYMPFAIVQQKGLSPWNIIKVFISNVSRDWNMDYRFSLKLSCVTIDKIHPLNELHVDGITSLMSVILRCPILSCT